MKEIDPRKFVPYGYGIRPLDWVLLILAAAVVLGACFIPPPGGW